MDSKITSEKELFDLIKKDFQYGARILVDKYGDFLNDKALFWGLENEDAEEIVSDVILNSLNKIVEGELAFQGEGKLKGLLYIALKNKCLDKFSRDDNIKEEVTKFSFDESELDVYEPENGKGSLKAIIRYIISNFESEIREDERINIIRISLEELKEDDQFCIKCYLNNKKHKEIGEMLNISEDAAKHRVGRALKTFCNNIAEKLNKNTEEIYEKLKQIHKQDSKGRIVKG